MQFHYIGIVYIGIAGLFLSSCASQKALVTSAIPADTLSEQMAPGSSTLHLKDGVAASIDSIAVRSDSLFYLDTSSNSWLGTPVPNVERVRIRYKKRPASSISAFLGSIAVGAGLGYVAMSPVRIDPPPLGLDSILTNLFMLGGGTAGALVGSLISASPRHETYVLQKNQDAWAFFRAYQ